MYRKIQDGAILSANTIVTKTPSSQSRYQHNSIHQAIVLRKIPTDDSRNKSKKYVEYDCIIISGAREGELIRSARPLDMLGGNENYGEAVYKPRTKTVKGRDKGETTAPENTDASYVIVGFINGYHNDPVILGGFRQPNNANSGVTDGDGFIIRGNFQGLSWKIDNSGNLKVNNGSTFIQLNQNGQVNITSADSTNITATGNVSMTSSANVAVQSSGTTTVTSTGAVNVTSSSGAATINGATGISFLGPSVKVGSESATESMVLGDLLKSYLDSHTHGGGAVPDSGLPTSVLSTKSKVE